MGTDDIYYDTETNSYRVEIDNINYTITPDILNAYYKVPEDIKEKYLEKFDEILSDVLIEFVGSGIRLSHTNLFTLEKRKGVVVKIFFSGTSKKTFLEYDIDAHEISGFVWMSLGDRDLTEITTEEIEIIRRTLLIWIYENV
jgi:hypothetical protein